ncbi:uncharacterized protein LOC128219796 [Mya arenaria]|uniref:uncharacterized protein LOC128211827 n=1 Tax=Mya arenaria TaxID=6604 RepID=UPI0022E00536|nr:uncharacterized protein LOC128211827 [Mya arenaria]XP_052772879.1 uncharacterized protein LOC128211827 [Mya arenaria]XP_052772888.1 uncharacterized protein LOC128211827 [Mya arenaria]XP_052783790.1 uncharacterized protein LOC128219796 [Mya arenaria]XP_052783799.1 uncharacterized protein LOC128219796 [Mya arenaria]XP_052783804.1 uncharacterized protein LOC128219796 [Mya arenaria]
MVDKIAVLGVVVATSAVAFPYLTALLINLSNGWPQVKHKYRRAFNPKKVYALNFAVIQKLVIMVRYASLYFHWKIYYKSATTNEIMKDRLFGRNGQRLDLYFPHQVGAGDSGPRPVVVFMYGGAWGSGGKKMYGLLCSQIANKLGVVVCCPDHSTYPKGYVDDMVQDVIDTLMWLHQNVEHYNGDKSQIMLVGHSSGAHLCALSLFELLQNQSTNQASSQPATPPVIQFSDQHFNGNSDNEDKHSSASSGSFLVLGSHSSSSVNDNGQNGQSRSTSLSTSPVLTASKFEILETQKSETEMSEVSMLESELLELTQSTAGTLRYRRTSPEGRESPESSAYSEPLLSEEVTVTGEVTVSEESDDDSVVTVTLVEGGETEPALRELAKAVKGFVGIAGVYHIGDHFQHESSRGVEDVSTMTRAMRGNANFDRYSPTCIARQHQPTLKYPKTILLHGTDDYVVPITSTTKFDTELKRLGVDCMVRIIPSCDHYEIAMDLMKPNRKFYTPVMTILEETAKDVFS